MSMNAGLVWLPGLSAVALVLAGWTASEGAEPNVPEAPPQAMTWAADLTPLLRAVDLNLGEERKVALCDGNAATVKLLKIDVRRDALRDVVREARVTVEVNGVKATLLSANYTLPQSVGGVQIDCPIVKAYLSNSRGNAWGLDSDARLRLWPAGSPWVRPGTFAYPVKQRWFASDTQMSNEPTFVDGVESPKSRRIYYHDALDFGGAEGLVEVVAAAEGVVICAGKDRWSGAPEGPGAPRYDSVTVLDRRGWYHRYSHLQSIDPAVKPGRTVKMGQRIGVLGKEGDSGGWSHLHFGIASRQPSGRWGTQEGYAFIWQAYLEQHRPKIIAVARPHHLLAPGQTATLDGGKSWCADGNIASYEWTFTDGTKASGAKVRHKYDKPGEYSEVLKVADAAGNVDYDFAVVQVVDPNRPKPPGLHLTYCPTFGIKPGDAVTFKVRAFGTTHGRETIDFGDVTPPARVKSDGNVEALARYGYASVVHRFARPGHYVVTARRANEHGMEAVMRVHVVVENPPPQ